MSRLLDGSNDQMVYTVPSSGINVTGAHAFLIVCRIMVSSDSTWLSLMEVETSGPANAGGLIRSAFTGHVNYTNAANLSQDDAAPAITDSDGWLMLMADKPAGSALVAHHQTVVGGTPVHGSGGASLPSPASINNGFIRIGGNDDFANIRVAAAAIFDKQVTSGEFNAINSAKTTQSIYDLTPVWLVDDFDGFANDYMNNADRTSDTGSVDDADDPSGWVYGISTPAGPSQRFMWMP